VDSGTFYGDNVILIQTNSKIIIAGDFHEYKYVPRLGIMRLNANATLDATFDATNNVAGTSQHGVNAGILLPDGKILVAGGFSVASGANRNRIARLNEDGTLDASFDPGTGPNDDIDALSLQPDGKIIVAGRFSTFNGKAARYIARLTSDGTLDTNFLGSADYVVTSLLVQPDGKIIVGGMFFHLNGTSPPNLARLNPDGTLDESFVSNVKSAPNCMELQQDGKILIGGDWDLKTGSGNTLGRLLTNGAWDISFQAKLNSGVNTIAIENDRKILIGGWFTSVNGWTNRSFMARLYLDGETDSSFAASPDNEVGAIATQADGCIVIAGGFGYVEGVSESGLARLFGDDRNATPLVEVNGYTFKASESQLGVAIPILRTGSTNAAVSVQYATADIEARAGADYIATNGLLTFGPGEVAKSVTVPLINDSGLEDLRRFTFAITNVTGAVLGSLSNATVAIIDDDSITQIATADIVTNELAGTLTVTLVRSGTNISSSCLCRTVTGTAVAGEDFVNTEQTISFAPGEARKTMTLILLDDTQVEPEKSFQVELVNPVNTQIGARSNLTVTVLDDDAPGHPAFGLNGTAYAVTSSSDGEAVLVGNFRSINGVARNRLGKVRPDASLDVNFDPGTGIDQVIYAVMVQPDGKIVCGGSFTAYDGRPHAGLVRVETDGSLDSTFDAGLNALGEIYGLAGAPGGGGLFASGYFAGFGGVARPGLTKLHSDGSVDTNFIPKLPANASGPYCIATTEIGGVLVGEDSSSGATNVCIRLLPDGSRDTNFSTTVSGNWLNSIVCQPDGKILVGGRFSKINGIARSNIARLNSNGSLDSTFDPGTGASGEVFKLMLSSNDQVVAVGAFTQYSGVTRNRIVRINSAGSIDPAFDPGAGADATIVDIAPLPSNQLAIVGYFRNFDNLPRYGFAILSPLGQLNARIRLESFSALSDLELGLLVEPQRPLELLCSSNFVDWQVLYTNSIWQCFTNLSLPRPAKGAQFYRIRQAH